MVAREAATLRASARLAPIRLAALGLATGVAAVGVAACGDPGPSVETVVRDSAGVTIVESHIPDAGVPLPWLVDPEPTTVIGAAEGAEHDQLYRVRGVARLSDGRVVVANGGTNELRLFGPDGAFLGAAGGEGGGPGEFRSMLFAGVLPGDSVVLYDGRSRRFTVMAPSPTFARSFAPGPDVGEGSVWPRGVLADGRIVLDGPAPLGGLAPGAVNRPARALMVIDREGSLFSVLDTLPGRATFFETDGGFSFTIVPFTITPMKAVGTDRVHAGTGARYEVRTYAAATGDLVRLTRLARPAEPVTEADLERRVERAVAGAASPEAGARLRRSYERMPIPDSMPLYQALEVDALGNLWVEDYRAHPGEPAAWTVFDPDGAVVGTLTVPDGLTVHEIGDDWILGTTRDEFDIPYVVIHPLHRGGG